MPYRLIVIALMLLAGCGQAAAQEAIGAVSRIQGSASGSRSGATEALGLNASVFRNQAVSTGEAARLEITFVDGTQVTLGEKARLTLDTFVFDPAAGRGTIKFAAAGAFQFLSGQVSKLASRDVSVTTPVATVGIRGTKFWGGPAGSERARAGHEYRRAGRRTRAGHPLAAGQGQPRPRHRDVPVAPLALSPTPSTWFPRH